MNAETRKSRESRVIPESVMRRIDACGIIFQADHEEKIADIMETRNVDEQEAARIYIIGTLKAMKRRGEARSYKEAVALLEERQVAGRHARIGEARNLDREVARINALNYTEPARIFRPGFIVDGNGNARAHLFPMGVVANRIPQGRLESKNMCKVLGTIYTQWEARTARNDPALLQEAQELEAAKDHVAKHLRLYFTEYMSRLSKTVQGKVQALKAARFSPEFIMSVAGRKDPETRALHFFVDNLFRNFEHKSGLKPVEFIRLLQDYAPDIA
jgi:hypothetical protein